RVVLRQPVVAGMAARRDAGPEHALRRCLVEVQHPVGEQPLLVLDALGREGLGERREPLGVLVQGIDLRGGHPLILARLTASRPCPGAQRPPRPRRPPGPRGGSSTCARDLRAAGNARIAASTATRRIPASTSSASTENWSASGPNTTIDSGIATV